MTESAPIKDFEWAIREVQRGDQVDPDAIRQLVACDRHDTDSALLAIIRESRADLKVATLASRILIERDRDRDPSFIEEYTVTISPPAHQSIMTKIMRTARAPQLFWLGIGRLRQVEPVRVYAEQSRHSFFGVRLVAVAVLGDTKDLAALDPLALALSDPNWRVRGSAADSVRRLRHAGAADLLSTHPVRDRLIECLADRHRPVRVAAARALGSMGAVQAIQEGRAQLHWWAWRRRRDHDRVLRGEIPPLPKIWPGDETT